MSDSLQRHGLQHARLPCPSLSLRVYSNSCPLSQWCHPTISSSVTFFSSCPQSCPASESFPMNWLFTSGGQSIGASSSVLPVNIQGWSPLGWAGWISLQSKGLSRILSNTTVQKHQFFGAHPSLWSSSAGLFGGDWWVWILLCPWELPCSATSEVSAWSEGHTCAVYDTSKEMTLTYISLWLHQPQKSEWFLSPSSSFLYENTLLIENYDEYRLCQPWDWGWISLKMGKGAQSPAPGSTWHMTSTSLPGLYASWSHLQSAGHTYSAVGWQRAWPVTHSQDAGSPSVPEGHSLPCCRRLQLPRNSQLLPQGTVCSRSIGSHPSLFHQTVSSWIPISAEMQQEQNHRRQTSVI